MRSSWPASSSSSVRRSTFSVASWAAIASPITSPSFSSNTVSSAMPPAYPEPRRSRRRVDRVRTAVVTGANRGIGLEVARQLAGDGFRVIAGSRDLEKGERAVHDLGGQVEARRLDVADPAGVAAFAAGLAALDLRVNTPAGFYAPGKSGVDATSTWSATPSRPTCSARGASRRRA